MAEERVSDSMESSSRPSSLPPWLNVCYSGLSIYVLGHICYSEDGYS